jgi:hypothetical protein
MSEDRDDFDEWEDRIESLGPQGWLEAEEPAPEPPLDFAHYVDLAAGEFFRKTWRRRLDDAQGDCGHVARQMRKAGVPLDLALAILLMPDPRPALPRPLVGAFDAIGDERAPSARDRPRPVAEPKRHLLAEAA